MTVPTSDESVRTIGASDTTVVVSSMPADFERDVDAGPLVDLQVDSFTDGFLEALDVDFDRVGAGHEERRRIVAVLVRDVAGGRPLLTSRTETVAPGTTPPASLTVPTMVPVVTWAATGELP